MIRSHSQVSDLFSLFGFKSEVFLPGKIIISSLGGKLKRPIMFILLFLLERHSNAFQPKIYFPHKNRCDVFRCNAFNLY